MVETGSMMCKSLLFAVLKACPLSTSPYICEYADSLTAWSKTNDETFKTDSRFTQTRKCQCVFVLMNTIRLS